MDWLPKSGRRGRGGDALSGSVRAPADGGRLEVARAVSARRSPKPIAARGWAAAVALLWVGGRAAAQTAVATPTAFVDVSVVPMDRERVLPHQTVVVQGDRIAALGPVWKVAVPATAVRVNGRGKFLIPGLADMHAHVPLASDRMGDTSTKAMTMGKHFLLLYLANGFTTIRVMGYAGSGGMDLRAQVASRAALGPRMYVGAGPVDGLVPDSAVQFVKAAQKAGYDFIKVHGGGDAGIDSAVATAHRVGLPVAGHPPSDGRVDGNVDWAIRAGYASIEHQIGLKNVTDARRHAAALKQAGVWVCPTLVQHDHGRGRLKEAVWPERRYMNPDIARYLIENDHGSFGSESAAERAIRIKEENQAIKVLHDAGVELLLGSDAPVGGIPGFEGQRELEALVEAGLTPYEALLTGTRNVAAYFGTLDSTGTVAVQKRADLVLLSGNPLKNIRHTARPAGVMHGGRWLPRTELDEMLEETLKWFEREHAQHSLGWP